jgi:hypothetical protein
MRRKKKSVGSCIELEVTLDLPRQSRGNAVTPVEAAKTAARERVPRATRLMALAVKYQGMVDIGELRDYADIARLGYVSRARVTQIMNLSNLAPDIQEELLFPAGILPPERQLREVARQVGWEDQRRLWRGLLSGLPRYITPLLSAAPA